MVKVLIADDETLLRTGLRMLLDGTQGIEVVAEAGNGEEAVAQARLRKPDVVLMDIRMPRRDGLDAARELAADGLAVVMLTAFDTDDFILDALRAGAAGFLLKDTAPAGLVDAVLRAAEGDLRLSPAVLGRLVTLADASRSPRRTTAPSPDPLAALTERERAVAEAVARGLTNAEIASELHLGLATVKTHLININVKLGTTNRVQVALRLHGRQAAG
ncbi:MAG: response regulator transcription factor [Microlunatus sp.]